MQDISYILREDYILQIPGYGIITFQEANAIEAFNHLISMQRDENYIINFLTDFLAEHCETQEQALEMLKGEIDKIYEEIRKTYFAGFFDTGESKGEDSPMYAMIDVLAKRTGDPYELMEKRTWRQCMAIVKGYIRNSRAGDKDGDKENQKMYNKDKIASGDYKDVSKDAENAADQYIKMLNAKEGPQRIEK